LRGTNGEKKANKYVKVWRGRENKTGEKDMKGNLPIHPKRAQNDGSMGLISDNIIPSTHKIRNDP
jgi:hypothetical protein